MTKSHIIPTREEFMVPFDSLFDSMIQKTIPSFEAEIPGLDKDEVSVDLEENILSISGDSRNDVKSSKDIKSSRYIKRELKRSSFKRSFKLSDNMNTKNITADFNNGVLLITIPKKEPEKAKKVKIL